MHYNSKQKTVVFRPSLRPTCFKGNPLPLNAILTLALLRHRSAYIIFSVLNDTVAINNHKNEVLERKVASGYFNVKAMSKEAGLWQEEWRLKSGVLDISSGVGGRRWTSHRVCAREEEEEGGVGWWRSGSAISLRTGYTQGGLGGGIYASWGGEERKKRT